MASKHVREIFNLSKSENIFDDFACSYNSMPGRVYLSENFCCFYSGFLGKTVKLILDFKCITKINKVSSTWKNNSIKIIYS